MSTGALIAITAGVFVAGFAAGFFATVKWLNHIYR